MSYCNCKTRNKYTVYISNFINRDKIGNLKLCTVDLGGHETVRKVWSDYFPKVDAIVYIVDSANPSRFEESKAEFDEVIGTPDLGDIPILILGNKVDKKGSVTEEELRQAFGLINQTPYGMEPVNSIQGKPIKLLMCAIAKKFGFMEGFEWLEKVIP